ncbi:MAG: diadenylate cyclase CdaA [Synergistes sp.]|nr:diadenylate cyclase CdaA [Synergistes sp.]
MFLFDLRWQDFIDIIIVAYLIYRVLTLLCGTRAMQLLRGLMVIGLIGVIAYVLELRSLTWIIGKILSAFIIVVPVLFQPELRHMLEELGKGHIWKMQNSDDVATTLAKEVTEAFMYFQTHRIGAICLFERDTSLKDVWNTAVMLDSAITKELLMTIFWPGTPLHDGAVVMDREKIVAAECYLPLTEETDISRWYGTRHRAALGVTEMSDCIALIVSEERGEIRTAARGHFSNPLSEEQLMKICVHYFSGEGTEMNIMKRIREEIVEQWSGDGNDAKKQQR